MVTRRELREQREREERRHRSAAEVDRAAQSDQRNDAAEPVHVHHAAAQHAEPVEHAAEQHAEHAAHRDGSRFATAAQTSTALLPPEHHEAPLAEAATRQTHRHRPWIFTIIAIVVIIGLAIAGLYLFRNVIGDLTHHEVQDYTGQGTGTVNIEVVEGDSGSSIATKLKAAGVVATRTAFLKAIANSASEPVFQPGSFSMHRHMSGANALRTLTNAANRNVMRVVVPEGLTVAQIVRRMVTAGFKKADIQAALQNPRALGVPASAHDAEGYLFPATYTFNLGLDATTALKQMVQGTLNALTTAGVKPEDWNRTIILASIVQKEARQSSDFPKVARVLENRLKQGMHLQLDSTVSYGAGGTTVTTTAKQRADKSNKYNTYAHAGLPVGAISNPGAQAIDAVVHPADGNWLFFVTVNLSTGKTVFSDTAAGHAKAVQQFRSWIQQHPHWNEAAN